MSIIFAKDLDDKFNFITQLVNKIKITVETLNSHILINGDNIENSFLKNEGDGTTKWVNIAEIIPKNFIKLSDFQEQDTGVILVANVYDILDIFQPIAANNTVLMTMSVRGISDEIIYNFRLINGDDIPNNIISGELLQDRELTSDHLMPNVVTHNLPNNYITSDMLQNNSITKEKIADNSAFIGEYNDVCFTENIDFKLTNVQILNANGNNQPIYFSEKQIADGVFNARFFTQEKCLDSDVYFADGSIVKEHFRYIDTANKKAINTLNDWTVHGLEYTLMDPYERLEREMFVEADSKIEQMPWFQFNPGRVQFYNFSKKGIDYRLIPDEIMTVLKTRYGVLESDFN